MDCDRVFVALTAGPFPNGGATDADVERHLHQCASCRRFAEALRPGDGASHEALTPAQRLTLPRYGEALSPIGASGSSPMRRGASPAWRQPGGDGGLWNSHAALAVASQQVAAFTLSPRRRPLRLRVLLAWAIPASVVIWGVWALGLFAR